MKRILRSVKGGNASEEVNQWAFKSKLPDIVNGMNEHFLCLKYLVARGYWGSQGN